MFEKRKYKVSPGLTEVGGVPVVRGRVEMSEVKARYHLALGRIFLPKVKKVKNEAVAEVAASEASE